MSTSNNHTLEQSIEELDKLKNEIVKLSQQEKAFAVVAKNITDIEKSLKSLQEAITKSIDKSNKILSESVTDAARGLTQISAQAEKRKWKITWCLMALIFILEIAILVVFFRYK